MINRYKTFVLACLLMSQQSTAYAIPPGQRPNCESQPTTDIQAALCKTIEEEAVTQSDADGGNATTLSVYAEIANAAGCDGTGGSACSPDQLDCSYNGVELCCQKKFRWCAVDQHGTPYCADCGLEPCKWRREFYTKFPGQSCAKFVLLSGCKVSSCECEKPVSPFFTCPSNLFDWTHVPSLDKDEDTDCQGKSPNSCSANTNSRTAD